MLKLFRTTIIIFVIAFSTSLFAQEGPKVEVFKLTDNLYRFTLTTNFSVNMLASVGPDGILLVDNGMAPAAEELKSKLAELSQDEVKIIINTHFHGDHMGANQLLGKNAKIIGHKNIHKQLTSGLNILQEFPEEALPTIEFDDSYALNFNGEEIKLLAFPGGHSDNDIAVWFTKSNVICLGGIINSENFPYIGNNDGGSFKNYSGIVQEIIKSFPENAVFVVGHGRNLTMDAIKKYHDMLVKTGKLVSDAMAGGKTAEQMQKENLLKDWESWGTGFVTTDRWIQIIANSINPPPLNNKESIAIPLFYTLKEKGSKTAIEQYEQLKTDSTDIYDFREFNLNLLGYSLLGKNKFEDAIQIFRLNVKQFPESANVYDSLGEAYEKSGNLDLALKNYKTAVLNAEKTNDPNLNIFKANLERIQK